MTGTDRVARYFGCRVVQRDGDEVNPLFVFVAPARAITDWSSVQRVDERPVGQGIQRVLRPSRISAIHHFLETDPRNTVPTSVLLAFPPGVATFRPLEEQMGRCMEGVDLDNGTSRPLDWGVLEFPLDPDLPESERPALIVDGQHRIHGLASYEDGDLPIVAVALLDAPIQEQAFQFIVINNKTVKVATDAVKAVVAHIPEAEDATLADRLAKVGVRYKDAAAFLRLLNIYETSPFRGILAWDVNPPTHRIVNLTTVEQSLRYLRTVIPLLEADEDSAIEVFMAIWRGVRNRYVELWPSEDGTQNHTFMTKVNLTALNEFLVDRVKFAWEMAMVPLFNPTHVEPFVETILAPIPGEFWMREWAIKVQDNANVRELIRGDLDLIIVNHRTQRDWDTDLRMLIKPA